MNRKDEDEESMMPPYAKWQAQQDDKLKKYDRIMIMGSYNDNGEFIMADPPDSGWVLCSVKADLATNDYRRYYKREIK